jgi:hypothetical protein
MGDGSHILCCVCDQPVPRSRWWDAFTWVDPLGVTCVAHRACLARLGEFELGLMDTPW